LSLLQAQSKPLNKLKQNSMSYTAEREHLYLFQMTLIIAFMNYLHNLKKKTD